MLHPEWCLTFRDNMLKKYDDVAFDGLFLGDLENFKNGIASLFIAMVQKANPMAYIGMGRVLHQKLFQYLDSANYSTMAIDPRFSFAITAEYDLLTNLFKTLCKTDNLDALFRFEHHMTSIIVEHAQYLFEKYGKKIYTVSPGLQWALENTELRRYPTSGFHLPYTCIYLTLPPKYEVLNNITRKHVSEGVYLVEDAACVPRKVRLILVGKPNENSGTKMDDAIYHLSIELPENATLEEAINRSLDTAKKQTSGVDTKRQIMKDGKLVTITQPGKYSEDSEVVANPGLFKQMQDTMVDLFHYVVNVMIYATHPDADTTFCDASKEYESLRSRAMKLPKGKKKDSLLQRAREMGSKPRVLLGGSIVIDRETKENRKHAGEEGRTVQVRSLVAGHFHLYWTGTGRKIPVTKWIQPFWRGPEYAPLTQKKHSLGSAKNAQTVVEEKV